MTTAAPSTSQSRDVRKQIEADGPLVASGPESGRSRNVCDKRLSLQYRYIVRSVSIFYTQASVSRRRVAVQRFCGGAGTTGIQTESGRQIQVGTRRAELARAEVVVVTV